MPRYIGELFDLRSTWMASRTARNSPTDEPLIVAVGSKCLLSRRAPRGPPPAATEGSPWRFEVRGSRFEVRGSRFEVRCQRRPTFAYNVGMATPSSIRFDPEVLRRLTAYVAAHPGTTLSSAGNRLVDEALRSQEH